MDRPLMGETKDLQMELLEEKKAVSLNVLEAATIARVGRSTICEDWSAAGSLGRRTIIPALRAWLARLQKKLRVSGKGTRTCSIYSGGRSLNSGVIERKFRLPFGYEAIFDWRARRSFPEEVTAVIGGDVLILDIPCAEGRRRGCPQSTQH